MPRPPPLSTLTDEERSILLGIYANGRHLCCPQIEAGHIPPVEVVGKRRKRLAEALAEMAHDRLGCETRYDERYFDRLVDLISPDEE